jgi:heptosyltransferase-2
MHPDTVVSFLRSRRAAILALGSGAPTRVGWNSGPGRRAYTVRAPSARKRQHQSDEYLSLPMAMGLPARAEWPSADGLGSPAEGLPCIVMAPAARFGPAKRWSGRKFATLARVLHSATGLTVLMVGSRAEAAEIAEIARWAGPGVETRAGRTTLPQLASLLRRTRLFVGNDSGAAHLAAWVGAPVVVLFGSTSPGWTRPIGPRVHVVYTHEPCSPCYARTCPLGHTNCLERIDTVEVSEICMSMVSRGSADSRGTGEVHAHE